jgi:hypothetical protein
VYTEILLKSKLWKILNELKLKSIATIRNVSTVHRAIASAEPLSYTTYYSVVEAPEKDEQLRMKRKGCVDKIYENYYWNLVLMEQLIFPTSYIRTLARMTAIV